MRNGLRIVGIALLCGVFTYAGAIKIVAPAAFLNDILAYRILPYRASYIGALYLPWLELACALAVLHPKTRRPAAFLIGAMCVGFVAALGSAWGRGLDISCGCFGSGEPVNYARHIGGNIVLIAIATRLLLDAPAGPRQAVEQ